ncbi:MAG TPA: xanthine dehydrogenase family protein molybdopterin-binding subunit [Vicinamibacteria bacterium]|nr:xanthine dehydrogenase family protein molybdopterin-binding subunit [Vicinamibacteria bacterium]
MTAVGRNARRREGPEKLCGVAHYVDDTPLPGCLHGATLRTTIPRGRIVRIAFDPAFPWQECVIARAEDIAGLNRVALIEADQPLLVEREVRHAAEPILLVAHPSRARALAALEHVQVEYEEEQPVLDPEKSEVVFKRFDVARGDVARGLSEADVIVEGTFRLPHQEHAYIETNGAAAFWEADGSLVVIGSLQCPYYVQKALKGIFGLTERQVRVIQAATGGGFGGKEEYPNMICAHAALLARKAGRPVKVVYDRQEDMLATTKRHPAVIRHRTGVARDGRLVAQDIDVLMDGGAYVTLSPVVLSRGTLHATGPYACPNVRIQSRVVATNTPPNGAFRGFGAPQTLFAAELQMDRVAAALGVDPLELRRRNVLGPGATLAVGQVLRESVGAAKALEACVKRSRYAARRRACSAWNRRAGAPSWRGVGLSIAHHGAGFTGSGEVYLASRAAVSLTRHGEVRVLAASTEFGQGTTTMFAQIAAASLGLPVELVSVATPDTSQVPNSGPTVASRTTMIVGRLVRQAALDLKAALVEAAGAVPATRAGLLAAARALCEGEPERRFEARYEKPEGVAWDDATYTGDAYEAYSYAAMAVELEIDRTTYEVRVRHATVAADIGTVIHPLFAEGQVIGGVVQGLGYALLESAVYEGGAMKNPRLTDYVIPTSLDTPRIDVVFVPAPYSRGPFGAKGVGELPMDVPGPAVAAAVHHALGVFIPELPITPERIAAALHGAA